jgi:Rrf2 family protein
MIEIARESQKTGILQKEIADRQDISNKYLDHIIYALKGAGLITNVRGKKSGYILARAPGKISMLDIHNAFEPGIFIIDCIMHNYQCERQDCCSAKLFWDELNDIILNFFKSKTLQEMLEKQEEMEKLQA